MSILAREVCVACGTDNSGAPVHPLSVDAWPLKQCGTCKLVYLTRVPDYQATGNEFAFEKTVATENARRDQARPIERRISKALKWFRAHVLKRNRALALAQRYANRRDATVIDVGCGSGGILASLPPEFRAIGIEISPALASQTRDSLSRARRNSDVIQADAISGLASFPAGTADVVLMISYLEHEISPLSVLRSTMNALGAGGHCIVKVPNFGSWNLAAKQKDWCGFRFPDHVNYFTLETLTDLATRAGFRTLPVPLSQRLPTSDNMWVILQKPAT
jgi:SAM-dependent methyltransferase